MSSKLKIIKKKLNIKSKKTLVVPANTINNGVIYELNKDDVRRDKKVISIPSIIAGTDNVRRNKELVLEVKTGNRYENNLIDGSTNIEASLDNLHLLELEKSKINKVYNWKKGQVNDSDEYINFKLQSRTLKLPTNKNLLSLMPTVYDQGNLGSCTANSVCATYLYNVKKQNGTLFDASRLFVYYNTRMIEGTINEDSGCTLQESMTSINKYGICEEKYHPYDISKFTNKPSDEAYTDGLLHQTIVFKRVTQNLTQLKTSIANGYPFVFGFLVFSSFESQNTARTGRMTMPKRNEKPLGGHAVVAVGYDDKRKVFIIRNSWGTGWGDKGNFYMPYDFIVNNKYCGDFWTMEKVE